MEIQILCGVWLGFVLAISFMEAPLKFRSPLVDKRIGVSIGRLVFTALNRVELVLLAIVLSISFYQGLAVGFQLWGVSVIIVVQTLVLLPHLDKRAKAIVNGEHYGGTSWQHGVYIVSEVLKVLLLLWILIGGRKAMGITH
ncbi:MAG: hypothetical protein AB3N16_10760 [Flavobacteriaceae bacterium]